MASRTRRRCQRGSAVVDFALVMVVLLPLFLGILQLALVLHVRNTLSSAAAEGARFAAVAGSSPEAGLAKAREQVLGAVSPSYAEDMRIDLVDIGGARAYRITIAARVPTLGLGGPEVAFTVSGNAVLEEAP